MTQLELFKPRKSDPAQDAAEMERVMASGGWRQADFFRSVFQWTDRRIRAAAEASEGRIMSYPGSPGYKLTSKATPEEMQHAEQALRAQARKMIRRSMQIAKKWHG